ncbi:MAG: hypothetical protein JRE10_08440 [Deltaproteobacteria bacterium]|nr:hypothetical protein [Deltaproteobacteria bacterium]
MHLKKSDLEKVSRELLSASWGVFSWEWDHRFEAFLAEFSADNADKFRAILERDFSKVWDNLNIREAPDIVQMCNKNFGGLRSGQLLFTTDPRNYLSSHRIACQGIYNMKKNWTLQTAQRLVLTMNREENGGITIKLTCTA